MRELTAMLMTFVLLVSNSPAVSAKPKGDWNDVKALTDQTIAVKTKSGHTSFGIVRFADDSEIRVEIAGKEELTSQEDVFRRDEIEKVWMATLRFEERNTGKGALIGAGAGLSAALLTALVLSKRGSDDPPVGIGAFPLYGAGVGAVIGRFKKKGHKKQNLIYSI